MPPHSPTLVVGRPRGLFWGALLAAHALAFIYGQFEDELVSATAVASTAAVIATWQAVERRAVVGMAPLLAFIFGNVIVFGYCNIGYVAFTYQRIGEQHALIAWMAALLVWGAFISGLCVDAMTGRERTSKFTGLATKWQTLALGGVVFLAIATMYIVSGLFSGRYYGSVSESGWTYYFQATIGLVYIFFLLLGAQLRGSILAPRNVAIVGFVIVLAFLQGLSGGREPSLMMCSFLLLGASLGPLHRTGLMTLALLLMVLGLVFVIAIGLARGSSDFGAQSVAIRAQDVQNIAAAQMAAEDDDDSSPLAPLFDRAFETTSQVIVDQTVRTQRFAGFEGVDALAYTFVPRFIAPDKPVIDDANEILERDYGFLHGYTRFPLTLVGDAYRRGGALWVFLTGLVAGIVLRLTARVTLRVIAGDLGIVALVMWSMICLRLYTESVWSLVSVLTYTWTKLMIQIAVFSALSRTGILLTEARAPG